MHLALNPLTKERDTLGLERKILRITISVTRIMIG